MSYTPTNILLTGGAGFIGSHVANMLFSKYPSYHIVVLDKLDYCASLSNLNPEIKFVKGDIQCADLVSHLLATEKIDTIMHFAAQTHVDNSFGNSLAFTMNNTHGTHVLLEAARVVGTIRRFINVSTDEVYGDTSVGMSEGLGEESVLEPTNPYSAAKAGAEMLCKAYAQSYNLPVIITRGNNVYGPRQYPEKLIPKFILLARACKQLPVHGDGSSTRSYLYIDDVVDAFDRVLHNGKIGSTYNIGTSEERTVVDVAKDILRVYPGAGLLNVRDRAFNDKRYYISSRRLRDELGWSQKVSWADGLERTVEWYTRIDSKEYWNTTDIQLTA